MVSAILDRKFVVTAAMLSPGSSQCMRSLLLVTGNSFVHIAQPTTIYGAPVGTGTELGVRKDLKKILKHRHFSNLKEHKP